MAKEGYLLVLEVEEKYLGRSPLEPPANYLQATAVLVEASSYLQLLLELLSCHESAYLSVFDELRLKHCQNQFVCPWVY